MTDKDRMQKLLGGYATGTLTPEEQQALFEAALEDQEIFDALAREQSLRDLLRDPAARAQLLASMDDVPLPWYRRFWKPLSVAAMAAAMLVLGIYVVRPKPKPAEPILVARVETPAPLPPAVVADQAAPAVASPKTAVAQPKMKVEVQPRELLAKKETAPVEPPPPPVAAPAVAPAIQAAPAAANEPVVATERKAAKTEQDALGVNGAVSGFLDAGAKQIPLENAQALFYSQTQLFRPDAVQAFGARDNKALARSKKRDEQTQAAPPQSQSQEQAKDAQNQVQMLGAGQSMAASAGVQSAYLGVNWAILRQSDGGAFVKVEANQLRAGDTVKLQLIPNDNGFLSVWENGAVLVNAARVERLRPFETQLLIDTQPGTRLLTILLARTVPAQPAIVRTAREQQSASDSRDHSTYVVNASGSPAVPVSTTIRLVFH